MTAKRNPVFDGVSQFGPWPPWFGVVDFEAAPALTAVLTCPIVTHQAGGSESRILRAVERLVPDCGRSINPVRMARSNKVKVGGWAASSAADTISDASLVLIGQTSTAACLRYSYDSFRSTFRRHHVRVPAKRRGNRNLGPRFYGLRGIGNTISSLHLAGIAAVKTIALRPGLPTFCAQGGAHGVYSIPSGP